MAKLSALEIPASISSILVSSYRSTLSRTPSDAKSSARYSSAVRISRVSTRQCASPHGTRDHLSVDRGDFRLHSPYAFAAKQPRLESGELQNVVSNAVEGLKTAGLTDISVKLSQFLSICSNAIHCVSKKHPQRFSYNSRKHWRIFIIFARNVTEKASNHMLLHFSTSPN